MHGVIEKPSHGTFRVESNRKVRYCKDASALAVGSNHRAIGCEGAKESRCKLHDNIWSDQVLVGVACTAALL